MPRYSGQIETQSLQERIASLNLSEQPAELGSEARPGALSSRARIAAPASLAQIEVPGLIMLIAARGFSGPTGDQGWPSLPEELDSTTQNSTPGFSERPEEQGLKRPRSALILTARIAARVSSRQTEVPGLKGRLEALP